MQQCVLLGGEPGVGKTTLVKMLLPALGPCASTRFICGSVRGQLYPQAKVLVLGVYEEDSVFSGTDRLSTALLHDIPALCEKLQHPFFADYSLLAEGSRIFTKSCIELLLHAFPDKVTLIEINALSAQARRRIRGSQNESWVKGIKTQVANVFACYEVPQYHLLNETPKQLRRNAETLELLLGIE